MDHARVAMQLTQFGARDGIPDADGELLASYYQPLLVRAEFGTPDRAYVWLEHTLDLTRLCIPQAHRPVEPRGHDLTTGHAEGRVRDHVGVSIERVHHSSRADVPDPR